MSQFHLSQNHALWGLEDYAVWVPLTDEFYANLKFTRITEDDFRSGDYKPQQPYPDSRTYLEPIIRHLALAGRAPQVLDVGGYVGRFSIEAALALRDLGFDSKVLCFEPGDTIDLVEANIALNSLSAVVEVKSNALSDQRGQVKFAVPDHAKITSRIVPIDMDVKSVLGPRWHTRSVQSRVLSDFLPGRWRKPIPFICKIDTEGHEAEVIRGIGLRNLSSPHALVVEFWPRVRHAVLFDRSFNDFLFESYRVLNIESSLYPKGYQEIHDLAGVSEKIDSGSANNIDLLLLSRQIPGLGRLCETLSKVSRK